MDTLLAIALGLGLAAACGFRVFVPMLVAGVAARAGELELGSGFMWLAGTPALTAFGVATVLEIAAYYVPWVDHLLDAVATPAALVAGVLVSAAVLGDAGPLLRWTVAVVAGGGAAAAVQSATVLARHLSTWATLGIGNPVIATAELAGAAGLALLAVAAPWVAAALVIVGLVLVMRAVARRRPSTAVT